ncbi:hypothetical protein OFB92_32540, partial [Escherichia coli]|nr:hypothetical protein [Escherichia coli]
MIKKIAIALILYSLFPGLSAVTISAQTIYADLVVLNANVRTGDKSRPAAEAIAVSGNRIVAIGNTAEIRKLAGPATRRI